MTLRSYGRTGLGTRRMLIKDIRDITHMLSRGRAIQWGEWDAFRSVGVYVIIKTGIDRHEKDLETRGLIIKSIIY